MASSQGRLRRAATGLPILAFTAAMSYVFVQVTQVTPAVMEEIATAGHYERQGIVVPVRREFYGIAILDELFSVICMAFIHLYSFADPSVYWQSFAFVTEYAGMYAIMLFESCRERSEGTFIA
jgi:hypothetical protein